VLPFLADAVSYLVSLFSLILVRGRFQEDRASRPRALGGEVGECLSRSLRRPPEVATRTIEAKPISPTRSNRRVYACVAHQIPGAQSLSTEGVAATISG